MYNYLYMSHAFQRTPVDSCVSVYELLVAQGLVVQLVLTMMIIHFE